MLPRYRRLVETLAQRGLLRVICGTDTLGVGINVPIRTVLITALAKYDGQRMRQLSAREFHQVAGRAGRAGYDTAGTVVVMAPEHEIENAGAVAKAGDDPKKVRKIVRKKAPQGFVNWGEASFERLVAAEPEPLVPQLQLTAAMLINVIARGGDVFANVRSLVFDNHEPRARQYELARRALGIFRTLVAAQVVVVGPTAPPAPTTAARHPSHRRSAAELRAQPAAVAVRARRDRPARPGRCAATRRGTGHYALDVVSVIEATLDDPRPVLSQQQFLARGEAVAAMKREGLEYDERMDALEEITYPKPLEELLAQSFEVFASSQPWVRDFELSPKSVVRDMFERALSFARAHLVLPARPQRGARAALPQRRLPGDPPDGARRGADLRAARPRRVARRARAPGRLEPRRRVGDARQPGRPTPTAPVVPPAPPSVLTNRRAFLVLVRNELFRRVRLAALQKDDELAALDPDVDWSAALDAYFDEHDEILTGGPARSPRLVDDR